MGTVHLHPRSAAPARTLATFAHELDAARYHRSPALDRRLHRLLHVDSQLRILALTGPGGAGKSAALREAARQAAATGHHVLAVDGRAGAEVLDQLEELPGPRTAVLVDEADRLGPVLPRLGERLAGLPLESRVVLAGRRLPVGWLPDPLGAVHDRWRLPPLSADEADAVLVRHGVDDPAARAAIAAWADGLPLALVLGASAWGSVDGGLDARRAALTAALERDTGDDLIERVAGAELDDLDPDLMVVTALAGSVDIALLTAVLPDRDAPALFAALESCTFVESVGGRLQLHPRLAAVVAARDRALDPVRAATTTLRIAAHQHDRAVAGDPAALARLAALVEDPALRAGLGPVVGERYFADRPRPHDEPVLRSVLDARHPGAWGLVAPWLRVPATRVVRRTDGAPVALVAAIPLSDGHRADRAPGRIAAALCDHATLHGLDDRVVITALQLTFADEDDPEVDLVRNAAALAHCRIGNPRADLVNLVGSTADVARESAVLEGWGYVEIPELARVVDGVPVRSWLAEVGEGGLAGLLYGAVTAEQGFGVASGDYDGEVLLQAVEAFHEDAALAVLPVAPEGLAAAAAAEHVRAWARTSVAARLVGHPELVDQLARRYFEPGATHESVMRDTYASRATYFRRLRRARELLTEGQRTPQE